MYSVHVSVWVTSELATSGQVHTSAGVTSPLAVPAENHAVNGRRLESEQALDFLVEKKKKLSTSNLLHASVGPGDNATKAIEAKATYPPPPMFATKFRTSATFISNCHVNASMTAGVFTFDSIMNAHRSFDHRRSSE